MVQLLRTLLLFIFALPGQSFSYAYDGLGNRTAASQGGGGVTASAALTYTPAVSNQYTTVANNRTGIATGSADPAATVTVNSAAAPLEGPWWGQSESTSSGSTAAWLNFSIDATLGGNTDHTDTALLIPPSSLSPAYDADGNLTDDGLRTFTWDAENRLLSVTTNDTLLPAGAPMYRASYQYDDGGRRIAQTVEARTVPNGVYVLVHRRCYLYDGWNCIAEYDYAPNGNSATRTLYRTQVWGQSLAPGGAGGLLLIRRHTGPQAGTHVATHDGNGNVTALINAATGTESARYDYDPFGNLLQATGPFAAANPYRFSTQFTDDITGLLYFGYRQYDPVHGRWLSRDPIGEAGGVNLYGFIGNDGINQVDVLGLNATRHPNGSVSVHTSGGYYLRYKSHLGPGPWDGPYASESDFANLTQSITGPLSEREKYARRMSADDTGGLEAFVLMVNWGLWDGFSFGCAGKNSTLVEQAREGKINEEQFNKGLLSNGLQAGTQILILGMTGGTSSVAFVGGSTLRAMGLGGSAALMGSVTEVAGNREMAAITNQPYAGDVASDAKFILINTALGTFIGRFATAGTVTVTHKVCCKASGGSTLVPVSPTEAATAMQEAAPILAKAEVAAASSGVPSALRAGQQFESEVLAAQNQIKNTDVWRPTIEQIDSATFGVIVGDVRYTTGGLPRGTILDSVQDGFLEIKGGTSILDSTYQLRLQTYRSLIEITPLTIQTTRPVAPSFADWLSRWGAKVQAPPTVP
jgi:RHS repeat-associated protein